MEIKIARFNMAIAKMNEVISVIMMNYTYSETPKDMTGQTRMTFDKKTVVNIPKENYLRSVFGTSSKAKMAKAFILKGFTSEDIKAILVKKEVCDALVNDVVFLFDLRINIIDQFVKNNNCKLYNEKAFILEYFIAGVR